ncbi:hypothetical protein M4914_16750 [Streptomyces somaliensis DSM 40738]|uniref:Lipoprotein n=1 Tax=Streptomyces somaliensis (strain ATCC 33201 / DSM 40738 / JCM 12659 / KCTC 9044 / NCTC 11332 / NRRL B-12077 / IP 733) TaxID=1134445 RepID=A0AA44IDV5_STRE0|nr:hypothetical protein [Streptomyces somaliensis]MCQ0024444.1 hypothetical protein [Streptomyces somaliensis DSM 40738]NKY15114.1 hypothetical protein [Streptomyces somaliensis DSM 40738]
MQKLVRKGAAVAAALVSAFALSACGSDGGDAASDGRGGSAAPSDGASQAAPGATLADAEGVWTGTTDGRLVTLTIGTGGQAVMVSEAHVCQGTAQEGDTLKLALTCKDDDTNRTSGTIRSADGKRLVVAWDSGRTDTLSKPDPGSLPTTLPSFSSLPSVPPRS